FLELEEEPDPGEVDAALAGQVTDPRDPPDVLVTVEADVGRGPGGAHEALVLVDPERPRMRRDDARRDADHVDRSPRVSIDPPVGHRVSSGKQPLRERARN